MDWDAAILDETSDLPCTYVVLVCRVMLGAWPEVRLCSLKAPLISMIQCPSPSPSPRIMFWASKPPFVRGEERSIHPPAILVFTPISTGWYTTFSQSLGPQEEAGLSEGGGLSTRGESSTGFSIISFARGTRRLPRLPRSGHSCPAGIA